MGKVYKKAKIGNIVSQADSGQKLVAKILTENEENYTILPTELSKNEVDDVVEYAGGITSIDFMMPEKEREILEKNLNLIDNQEEMQKALVKAEKNAALRQKIRNIEMVDYLTDLIDDTSKLLKNTISRRDVEEYIDRMIQEGDLGKALKEIGIMNKANIDARNELLRGMGNKQSNKRAKVAVKFTNNSGEETAIFVEG